MDRGSQNPVAGLNLPSIYIERAKQLCQRGNRTLLSISGSPGAGKSTVAELLATAIGEDAVVIPMDGFHLSNKELERLGKQNRKGAPDTFDVAGYKALLNRLKTPVPGEIIYAPAFCRDIEEPIAGSIPVSYNTSLVITEGNYLLFSQGEWNSIAGLFDESWFVTASVKERQDRLIKRHMYFGRTYEEAKNWVEQTDEPNAQLIERDKKRADLIISWENVEA